MLADLTSGTIRFLSSDALIVGPLERLEAVVVLLLLVFDVSMVELTDTPE